MYSRSCFPISMTFSKLKRLPLFLCLMPAFLHAQDADLRANLERAYARWRVAVEAKDAPAWAGAITMHRQVTTRNLIVSQGLPFPRAVFDTALNPADTSGLRFLEAQAVGDTAHLLYFGKANIGGDPDQVPENLLMLKFFRENGTWKFDSNKLIQLRTQPEIRAQLAQGGTPDFLDRPEFTPPGKTPATPPVCPVPEHIGGCTLQALGFEVDVTLNGYDYYAEDRALKFFAIGGIKNGANELTLKVKPADVPDDATRLVQLDIFVQPKKPGQQGVRVFHYENKDPKFSGTVKLPFTVDAETLAKGR
jgi:hypothetical protein